jgi:hypothetical protein
MSSKERPVLGHFEIQDGRRIRLVNDVIILKSKMAAKIQDGRRIKKFGSFLKSRMTSLISIHQAGSF